MARSISDRATRYHSQVQSEIIAPDSVEEMTRTLAELAAKRKSIELGGAFSKQTQGGPLGAPESKISSRNLRRLLAYEPADLTVSVEAGMPYAELTRRLAENNQMIPLDPPFADQATVGGVVAADSSGPRRRRYGTARDMVIGMQFATLEGKLVQSGGMVVKNVTGLDMAKLLIGSLGTLAAIATVNFKVTPRPETSATFLFRAATATGLEAAIRGVLQHQLQPFALDLQGDEGGFTLAAEAMGSAAVVQRYQAEYEALTSRLSLELESLSQEPGERYWQQDRSFAADVARAGGAVLRTSCTLTNVAAVADLSRAGGARVLARAGNGVVYAACPDAARASALLRSLREAGFRTIVEQAPEALKQTLDLWAEPGSEIEIMRRIKAKFDPGGLLNRGRLYGRV